MNRRLSLCCFIILCSTYGCGSSTKNPNATTLEIIHEPDGGQQFKRTKAGRLHGRNLSFYPSGQLRAILYYKDGLMHGIQRSFYPNGSLRFIKSFEYDVATGKAYEFYSNGNVATIQWVMDTLRTGPYRKFYRKPWRLYKRADYVLVGGQEHKNGYIEYDTLGRVLDRWGFVDIQADKDTLKLGETVTLKLRILYPKEPRTVARVYGYDSAFRLVDPKAEVAVEGKDSEVVLRIQPEQTGPDTIRGYVADYKVVEVPGQGKQNKERPIYFSYPYYVRP